MYVIREGWEGLVRGNQAPQPPAGEAPSTPRKTSTQRDAKKGAFVPTYGEGELLKEGEGEQTLKGRYIIQVRANPIQNFDDES